MNMDIIDKIKRIKLKYESEGFIILGIFGSYARGDETEESDIDILFEMTDEFYGKHSGWNVFPVIDVIEKEFEEKLGKHIDLVNKNALNKIGKKYILPEVLYV